MVIYRNPRATSNRLFALLMLAMSIWSFGKIFIHNPYCTLAAADFYDNISAIGWISFPAIYYLWVKVFAGYKLCFKFRLHYCLTAFVAFLFIQELNGQILAGHVRMPYGWGNVWANTIWCNIYFIYVVTMITLAAVALMRFARWPHVNASQKKQAYLMISGVIAPFILGMGTDVVLPILGIHSIPDIANVFTIIVPAVAVYAMAKYKFLTITPAMAAQNIISTITDFLILIDPAGQVVTVNNSLLNFLEYETSEVVGASFTRFFPVERAALDFFAEIKDKNGVKSRECYLRTKNGIDVPVIFSASVLKDEYGTIAGFVCVARDITELKKTEDILWRAKQELEEEVGLRTADLRLANEQLNRAYRLTKDILTKAPFGIYVVNTSGTVEYVNDALVSIVGLSAEYLAKTNVFNVEDYQRIGLVEKIKAVFDRDESFLINAAKIESYYSNKPATVNYRGIFMQEESGPKALVFVEDITEKLRLEEELRRSHKLESVGVLAGGIAHDFNNILSIILSNVSFARINALDNAILQEPLLEAEKSTRRARELTQQLLIFSRGGLPVKKVVSIKKIIVETTNFALQGSRSRAEFDIQDDLWPVEVDVGQINQAIQNLVINADQAMSQGGIIKIVAANIEVKAQNNLPLNPGRYVKISVKDNGIGIPPEHLSKIFDPYFTTKQKGSGLGLAITYSVIVKHNGFIGVDSKLGEGTQFDIYLPASESLPEEISKSRETVFLGHGRIMIMDDEDYVRHALARSLKGLGYEAVAAPRGEEVLEIYNQAQQKNEHFDLFILDLTIPGGMGGLETFKRLKALDPKVRAIVSSGYSNDPVMADHTKFGFIDVLAKPYDVKALSEVVYRALHK